MRTTISDADIWLTMRENSVCKSRKEEEA